MPNARDILTAANTAYRRSTDRAALDGAAAETERLLAQDWLSAENRENADALLLRLRAKSLALAYFNEGYCAEEQAALTEFLDRAVPAAQTRGYGNTAALLLRLRAFLTVCIPILADAARQAARVRSAEGEAIAASAEEARAVEAVFARKAEESAALRALPLFGDGVAFPDVAAQIAADLNEVCAFARRTAAAMEEETARRALGETAERLPADLLRAYEYYPVLAEDARPSARVTVLCTPFEEEADLYAARQTQGEVVVLPCDTLASAAEPEKLLAVLAQRGADVLVRGAERDHGGLKNVFLAAIGFARRGRKIFFTDRTGRRAVFDALLRTAQETGAAAEVAFRLLSMPVYAQLYELLEEKGMVKNAREAVRSELPFLGFVGLNEAVRAFAGGRDWREAAVRRSRENAARAGAYLMYLPAQSMLLDSEWGTFSKETTGGRGAFDYDDIRVVDPVNIRKIMEGDFTIYQKCGAIVRYCTLCGQDRSVWTTLPDDERERRIAEATRLVMRALDVDIVPQVYIRETLHNPHAGGTCCEGGRVIYYKKGAIDDYDWLIDCICHECFHAFQYKAITGAWCEWYWAELGVNRARIEEWRKNHAAYIDLPNKGYRWQVYESEANAFALESVRTSGDIWNQIAFE